MDAYRLGIEKFRQGDLCDAKRYFEAALIDAPDDPKIHCDLGVTQMTVLVKKSDRLLFMSFWFARQSVSGLFLLPASTVGASFG